MQDHLRISAGIIPVRFIHRKPIFLLLRVFHYWDFPKGGIISKETDIQAAVRELKEETAIKQISFPWGTKFYETPPYAKGKIARYFLGKTEQTQVSLLVNPIIGIPEHHEFRWVYYEAAHALLSERVQKVLNWGHQLIENSFMAESPQLEFAKIGS